MKQEFNGFDLTFVNICNEAFEEKQEWEDAKNAGINAVKEGRIKRQKRIKMNKLQKKIYRKERLLATTTCAMLMIFGCIEF